MIIKDRKYSLIIGDNRDNKGREITDLNITFSIHNTTDNSKKSNKAVISIFNLDEQTLKLFDEEEYIKVFLSVGYETVGVSNVLVGDVLSVSTRKQGTDRVTKITMAEGYTSLNFNQMTEIVKTSNEGTTVEKVIDKILLNMRPILKGNFVGSNIKKIVSDDYPLVGTPKEMLDELCRAFQIQYEVSRGLLNVSNEGGAFVLDNSKAYLFNEKTGLINIPYRSINTSGKRTGDKTSRNGVTFTALLNPFVRAGDLVRIESESIEGFFKVKDIKYIGNYRGKEWYIECYCEDIAQSDKE